MVVIYRHSIKNRSIFIKKDRNKYTIVFRHSADTFDKVLDVVSSYAIHSKRFKNSNINGYTRVTKLCIETDDNPKPEDLYKILRERSKNKATVHLISMNMENVDDILVCKYIERIHPGMTSLFVRGDIIENVLESGYRSEGVYFFDGKDIVNQYTGYDDYGTPPLDFNVISEFPLNYWVDCNIQSRYVDGESKFYWHCDLYCYTAIDLKVLGLQENISNNPNHIKYEFCFNGQIYLLVN